MKSVLKWLKRITLMLFISLILFILYGTYAYRDIEPDQPSDLMFAKLGHAEIAYKTSGLENKDKPALVMIHSMFYHMGLWDNWVETLDDSYRVYRFDVAGHGQSGLSDVGDYSLEATMQTLEDFMTLHKLEEAILVGSSMGGATAFNYAAANPEKVTKLVLVNPGGLEGHDDADSGGAPGFVYWVLRYMPDWSLEFFVDWTAADNDTGDGFRDSFITNFRAPGTREGIFGRMNDFKSPNTRTVLPLLTMPTMVMWGDLNPQLPVEQAFKYEELIAQGSVTPVLKIYEGAGHVLPAEPFEQPVKDLIEFIEQ